jgi:hypothetical protein
MEYTRLGSSPIGPPTLSGDIKAAKQPLRQLNVMTRTEALMDARERGRL